MAGTSDQEMTAIGKIVCYTHRFQEEGAGYAMGTTQSSTRAGQEAPGMGGHVNKSLCCGFRGKEQARRGCQLQVG